jgi:hypothetical protein
LRGQPKNNRQKNESRLVIVKFFIFVTTSYR